MLWYHLIILQGWLPVYDEEIPAERIPFHTRPRSNATAVGPSGVETRSAVMEHYGLAHNINSSRFSEFPPEFALRITSLIKESFAACHDPVNFSIIVVSFVSGCSILSDDCLDSDTVEILKLQCSDAYVAACLALKPSESSVFLNMFDAFLSQARSLLLLFSADAPIQVQKCQFLEKLLFKCAVDFLGSLMPQMKNDVISSEVANVFKFLFPLCANPDISDELKISKLKPAMKILRTCLIKSDAVQSSELLQLGCDCLLSALVSVARENSSNDVQSYEFKCALLSHANEWLVTARNFALDLFNGDEEFQPKVFQSTHPYADNRASHPNPSSIPYHPPPFPCALMWRVCSDSFLLSVDTIIPIDFSDAVELKIVFDQRCRTESGCDYIRFYQGENIVGAPKYHGRNPGDWPGVGTTPPLVVKGSHVEARFHSDGSNNDWGYYFTGHFLL
jgi:hypothetical protein